MSPPILRAIDDPDGTFYALTVRPEWPPIICPWPQPLIEVCPNAVRVPAFLGDGRSARGECDDR